ncbi:hypothetical protein ACMDCT_08870 [Halomonadaceae bacterium KBTZ08]
MGLSPDQVDIQVRETVANFIRDRWIDDVTQGVKEGATEYIEARKHDLNYSLMASTAMGLAWILAPQAMATQSVTLSVIGTGAAWANHFRGEYNDSLRDPANAPGNVSGLKNRMIDRLQKRPFEFAHRGAGQWLIDPLKQFILGEVQAGSISTSNKIKQKVADILENLSLNNNPRKRVMPTDRGKLSRATKQSIKAEAQRWEMLYRHSHRSAGQLVRRRPVAGIRRQTTTIDPKIIVKLGDQEHEADPKVQDWLLHNSWRLEVLGQDSRLESSWNDTEVHRQLKVTLARGGRATLPKPGTKGEMELTTGSADLPTNLKVTQSDIRRALNMAPNAAA